MITTNIRIGSESAVSADTPKTPRARPPSNAFPRSKCGEATVMRRLPLSILPAVERLLTRRLAEAEAEAGDPDVWESR